MALILPGVEDVARASRGALSDPGLRAPRPQPSGLTAISQGLQTAAQETEEVAQVLFKAENDHDKAVAAKRYNETVEQYRQFDLNEGPGAKTPTQLFGDGSNVQKVYDAHQQKTKDFGNKGREGLSERQTQFFNRLWQKRADQELDSTATTISNRNRQFRKDAIATHFDGISERVGTLATSVEADWRNWHDGFQAVLPDIRAGIALGASAQEVANQMRSARVQFSKAAVRGWFKEQPDRVIATEQIYSGKFNNAQVQKLWESLSPDDRQKLYRGVLQDQSKLLSIRTQAKAEARRVAEDNDRAEVKRFYFDEDADIDERDDILERMIVSPHINRQTIQAMQDFQRAGDRNFAHDDEVDLTLLETNIRTGAITNRDQLIDYMNRIRPEVSRETIRTKIIPMIEARRSQQFRDVMDWGQSTLGIPSTGGILGDFFKDPINKAAKFEAQMRVFKRDNPQGDLWGEAKKIIGQLQTQGNSGALQALPIIAQKYRDALKTGNEKLISAARGALISIMVQGALVQPLESARQGFDPLQIIDRPQDNK